MPPNPEFDEHGFPLNNHSFPSASTPEEKATVISKRTWKWVLVVAFLLGVIGLYGKQGVSYLLVRRATDKFRSGDMAGATYDLEQAARWSPDNLSVYELRAEMHLRQDKVDAALADLDQMARISPDSPRVFLVRGKILEERGDWKGAEADFTRLIALQPDKTEGYQHRSRIYQRQSFAIPGVNKHRQAVDDLSEIIRLDSSNDPMTYNNRAYARALGNIELEAGLEDAEKAVDLLDPLFAQYKAVEPTAPLAAKSSWAAILDTRGHLHYLLGHHDKALEDLQTAVKMAEECTKLPEEALQKTSANLELRQQAMKEVDQTLSVLYHHRGEILQALNQSEAAQADLDLARQLGYNPAGGVF